MYQSKCMLCQAPILIKEHGEPCVNDGGPLGGEVHFCPPEPEGRPERKPGPMPDIYTKEVADKFQAAFDAFFEESQAISRRELGLEPDPQRYDR